MSFRNFAEALAHGLGLPDVELRRAERLVPGALSASCRPGGREAYFAAVTGCDTLRRVGLAREHQLFQATLEVQYDRGIVYYDRCGSLMLSLRDALGAPPFEGTVPAMQFGELRSDAERIVVRYGPANVLVTQSWIPSPARFEQLSPLVWETVAKALDIPGQVTRLGVRFVVLWKVDSLAEAIGLIERMGVGRYDALFGGGSPHSINAVVRDRSGDLRMTLDAVTVTTQGDLLPKGLVDIVPGYAVQLDLDHVHPRSWDARVPKEQQQVFTLSRAQLKDFIRASWQRTREFATKTRTLLGGPHGE